jgi:MFS transporter, AAHS family, 4-hydroxybenzoate transporter
VPFGWKRPQVFAVCYVIQLMDAFDAQSIGFAAKSIEVDVHIPIATFGQVFSAGLFGAMAGAFLLGPLADRFGRRWMLTIAVVTFAAFTLLTPSTYDLNSLLACRFLAGLGLGGAIPNALALSSEYTPKRYRGLMTGVLCAVFPLRGFIGAVTSAKVLPVLGWPMLFYIGGVIPFLLALAVVVALPESLQFLLKSAKNQPLVTRIARDIDPALANFEEITWFNSEEKPQGVPIKHLFTNGRAASTLLLPIFFFMCFVLLIVLVPWTPARVIAAAAPEVSVVR